MKYRSNGDNGQNPGSLKALASLDPTGLKMSKGLQIINPIAYASWNDLLLSNQDYSFFHSSNWAKVLHESYGYNPFYFTVVEGARLTVLIPLMEVSSSVTGKRGVSLPFSDYCTLLAEKGCDIQGIFESVVDVGKKLGWRTVEFRDSTCMSAGWQCSSYYIRHLLDLSPGEEEVLGRLRKSTRRNIRKAIKEGVEIEVATSPEAVDEFYRLNCMTRRRHGLPPQPHAFFRQIYKHVISENAGIVVLASHGGKSIAGAMYFHMGEKAYFKYGASVVEYQRLRPNNLVMWEAIKWYARQGYKNLCLGRTEPENEGLRQFKTGWGVEERIMKYYKFDIAKTAFVDERLSPYSWQAYVFRKLPIGVSMAISSLLYKHLG